MAIDVEDLLADLGRAWNASVQHVALTDILERDGAEVELTATPDLPDSQPRRRWLMAATAAVAAAAALVVVIVRRDDEVVPPVTTPSPTATTAPLPVEGQAGVWSTIGPTATDCSPCADSALLGDDRVIIVSGSAIQIFDPATTTFSIAATLPENHSAESVVVLADGRALLTGINGEVALFDPGDKSVRILRDRHEDGTSSVNGIQLADGTVLLFGARVVESLDLETGTITRVAGGADVPRAEAPYVFEELTAGRVLVGDHLGAHVYEVATGTFNQFDADTRGIVNSLRLDDGRLLIVRTNETQTLHETSRYDIETGALTPLGPWTAMTLLPTGGVLAYRQPGVASTAAMTLHDLTTGEVTEIPSTRHRHWLAEPVALADGRLLIFGDYPGNGSGVSEDTTTAEIFVFSDTATP